MEEKDNGGCKAGLCWSKCGERQDHGHVHGSPNYHAERCTVPQLLILTYMRPRGVNSRKIQEGPKLDDVTFLSPYTPTFNADRCSSKRVSQRPSNTTTLKFSLVNAFLTLLTQYYHQPGAGFNSSSPLLHEE